LFRSIHEKLGGRLRGAVSGAAPLDPATFQFFRAIGAPIYEGYGLTETGPVISVNHPGKARKGSAGQPLPGLEVKIANPDAEGSGEILTRGPHLMQGYFRNEELTREAIDADGWFHTGDLGRLDRGYLRITGRLKGLIVLPSGKKVHAEEVEQALSRSRYFQDVCVIGMRHGDKGELLTAVIYPAEDFAAAAPDRHKEIEREAMRVCRDLSAFKQPQRIIVRDAPFAKTSSGKVKRHVVLAEVNGT
ncbi:MAG: long-chain fatty acid--CoA ligase, partial [Proteobacteria bacterium]